MIFLDNTGVEIYASRRDKTRVLACATSVKEALHSHTRSAMAAPLVLGRFINVVSRCFFSGLKLNCMNNLATRSTDVNQDPSSAGPHDCVRARPALRNVGCAFTAECISDNLIVRDKSSC